ncbi:zona pellucida sperm-binding 4-like protein [Labeo rohita]|uniref:Zona pellucida sperm-binding 4-like protein n=1 Tax=Labeo rohita TaxID=84645 RepID=A0A498N6F9_LABRO|nr:zona pellucida sperm-binding 4-like protein [Labeo rohita]RXN32165.1 zona pellucida sperm-binding 4-like protein [Labeo rohita]
MSWYGTDLDLSCPVSVTPPSFVCKNNAMELTVVGDGTADELSVALNGEWAPLLYVATQCWHRELSSQGDLTFLVPYTSCGVNFRDGRFILDLRSKDKMIPLSCPYDSISGLSLTNQPLPQREPSVYHKSPTGFPTKAIAGQIVKEEHGFLVEQLARNAARTPAVHPRSHLLPKLPSLPGSFNLAVNFPFSLPIPSRPAHRDQTSKPVDLTPAPTPAPTPDPTVSSSEFTDSVQSQLPHHVSEQIHQELAAPVTKAPKSEHHYMQYPYTFQKPVSAFSQTEPSLAQEYQPPRMPVPSAALYQPYGMTQNFPKPNPLHVNPAFASLAPYIPPGYYLCPFYNQHPPVLPQMFQPPVPTQPLLYQKPSYQKPEITPLAPTDPAVPPMKEYSEQQLASAVASSPHDSGSQRFQPTQYQPYLYQSSHGRPSSTTPLSPTSQLIPIYLQSQTRQYPPYPAFQDARPAQPQYYQMLNQPSGSVQQPWTTSRLPVKSLPQESRPLMLASSQTPEHLQYQTGGDQALDLYQRSGTGISSPSQYQLSEFPKFPYPALRPENGSYVLSLLWWGSPIKISCPVTPVISQPTPSVLCSQFGMVIAIEGAQEAAEKYRVKALPETTQQPAIAKPAVIPHLLYEQPGVLQFQPDKHLHTSHHGADPIQQTPSIYQHQKPPAHIYPMYHHPAPSADTPKPSVQQHLSLSVEQIPQTHEETVPQYPMMPPPQFSPYPISCPPYPERFCSQYPIPYHHPPYHQPAMTTASQPTMQPVPWTSFSQPTYKPMTPAVMQVTLFPQLPIFRPTPPAQPPKMSPSINCTRDKIMATLPSARADSFKVKAPSNGIKTEAVPILEAPSHCGYSVKRECTMDRHFVFSVHSSAADPPLSPASLVTAGVTSCTPQKVTADLALFKIPLDECGVHRYEVGKTVIYMVEILNRVQPLSLNYGTITRESPVRLLVECRYLPGSVVSVGYLVKSPTLGPSIKAQGVFGVQLRISKDERYNDFYPQYHQPLRMLLGKPLYLEVRLLNPPDPTAMLLVHYCVAYPRSAKSAWILIYDGCPNFLDHTPTHKPPATPAEALTNHVRRFTITTFQFLPEDANLQTDEEV